MTRTPTVPLLAADTVGWLKAMVSEPATGAKLGIAAISVVGAVLWDALTGVLFLVAFLFWICDMSVGAMRAVADPSVPDFGWRKFLAGMTKFPALVFAVFLAGGAEVMIAHGGEWIFQDRWAEVRPPLAAVVIGFIGAGFFISAVENLEYWYPGLGKVVRIPRQLTDRRSGEERRQNDGRRHYNGESDGPGH